MKNKYNFAKSQILSCVILLTALTGTIQAQTTYFWRTEATNNIWQTSGNFWNGAPSAFGFGRQEWNNNHELTQVNNQAESTYRFVFESGATSGFTFSGSTVTFFDFGGLDPAIINNSSGSHNINLPIVGDDNGDALLIQINNTGNLSFGGTVNNNGSFINVEGSTASSTTVAFSNVISGIGGLYKTNSNITLELSGANTYTGITEVNAGRLSLLAGSALVGSVEIHASGNLYVDEDITVSYVSENGLNDGGIIEITSGHTLTMNGANQGNKFQNSISGAGNLAITGSGNTVIGLYGTQSYTGSTAVSGGKLTTGVAMSSGTYSVSGGELEFTADNLISNAASFNITGGTVSFEGTDEIGAVTASAGTIVIAANKTVTMASLDLSGSATLDISEGGALVISGNLTNSSTNPLTINASISGYGQLKVNGSITNTGTINHEQYFTGGWQMVAASMNATTASYFGSVGTDGGTVNTQNLFSWDGTQYVNVVDNAATISPGTGYFGYVGTNGFRTAANATYSFTGTPNTSVTPTLNNLTSTATMSAGSNDGWNLIANPFTCALDWTTITEVNVNDAFYIFDPSTSGYKSYSTGGISVGHIAPMQSFWVQANAGSPSLGTLTMSANGTVASAPQLYKTSINFDRLVLRTAALNDSTAVDYTVVSFIENNSNHAYDGDWDARKLYNAGELPNIYSTFKGEEMAVNAIDFGPSSTTTGSIDISYRAPHVGNTYEISFDKDYMLYRYMVVLEDKKTGTFTNLGESNYQFNFDDTYIDRFVLHFNAQGIGMEDLISNAGKATLEAWAFDGAIHYQANYGGSAELILIDLSGQNVWTSSVEFNQGERASLELGDIKAGVYLLKSTDAEGRSNTTKVYLK